MSWDSWLSDTLDGIRAGGRWRSIRTVDCLSFASNDYLGLSQHRAVVAAARDALDRWGAGSTASRLVVGSRPIHDELEAALAAWKGTEAALLFPTGFATNLGVLSVLGEPDVTIFSDELNHASIVDGCRLSRAAVQVYRHCDIDHLVGLMVGGGRAVVVTDSVFSMDGDVAPVDELISVCEARGAVLVLDEAHAVLGPSLPLDHPSVLRVGTLSKTLGSLGGFVAGSRQWIDLFINRARPFIFTTAPTPADTAAALAALNVVRSPIGAELLARLRAHVERLRPGHPSPIIPIVLGSEQDALAASAALFERGLLVPAIRPPTVPVGTSRLRLALSAAHTEDEVDRLLSALVDLHLFHGAA